MNAAQIKSELAKRGLRAVVERVVGGIEYALHDAETDATLASGWCAGKPIDGFRSAYEDALRLSGEALDPVLSSTLERIGWRIVPSTIEGRWRVFDSRGLLVNVFTAPELWDELRKRGLVSITEAS